MSNQVRVAILGATGAVGTELINLLIERKFPLKDLKLLASPRSAGKKVTFQDQTLEIEAVDDNSFDDVDIVLASAGGSTSKQWAEKNRCGWSGDDR